MAATDLDRAREALEAGKAAAALRHAWSAARPAVMQQDPVRLEAVAALARDIAAQTDGTTRADAEQLNAYCTACILEPADQGPPWSLRRLFGKGAPKRKKCPDCAELIAPDARVCRFCGYRYPVS